MKLDYDQIKTLINGSLTHSYFELGEDKFHFFECYLKLLHMGKNLPLPHIVYDLLGVLDESRGLNKNRLELEEDTYYYDQFLLSFEHSEECFRIKELGATYKGLEFWNFFQRFVEIFFSKIKITYPFKISSNMVRKVLINEDLCLEESRSKLMLDKNLLKCLDDKHIITQYRQFKPLFEDQDFWDLRTVLSINSDAMRYAIKDCKKKKFWLEEHSSIILRKVRKELTKFFDDKSKEAGEYPVGGISEISTKGNFSNLLHSELIYSDIKAPETNLDLFDCRWLEQELLYYKRDTNQIEEHQMDVWINIDAASNYPSLNGLITRPFFIFSLIAFWIEYVPKINQSYKFNFKVFYKTPNERQVDFFKVLKTFLNSFTKLGKLELVSLKNEDFPSPEDRHTKVINISKDPTENASFFWNKESLIFKDPRSDKFQNFEYSDVGILKWVELFFIKMFE